MKAGSKFASGRPATGRTVAISVRISKQAAEILSNKKNKSEYIDLLIRHDAAQEGESRIEMKKLCIKQT